MSDERTESTKVDLEQWRRALVVTVARTYMAAKELPVMCASNYDPTPITRSRKWTPQSCEFVCDVENAVRRVLENKPDADELVNAWERLQDDSNPIGKREARVIKLLAPIFETRELHPTQYFRRVRLGSPHRRAA
jgi:hypothetical protein